MLRCIIHKFDFFPPPPSSWYETKSGAFQCVESLSVCDIPNSAGCKMWGVECGGLPGSCGSKAPSKSRYPLVFWSRSIKVEILMLRDHTFIIAKLAELELALWEALLRRRISQPTSHGSLRVVLSNSVPSFIAKRWIQSHIFGDNL